MWLRVARWNKHTYTQIIIFFFQFSLSLFFLLRKKATEKVSKVYLTLSTQGPCSHFSLNSTCLFFLKYFLLGVNKPSKKYAFSSDYLFFTLLKILQQTTLCGKIFIYLSICRKNEYRSIRNWFFSFILFWCTMPQNIFRAYCQRDRDYQYCCCFTDTCTLYTAALEALVLFSWLDWWAVSLALLVSYREWIHIPAGNMHWEYMHTYVSIVVTLFIIWTKNNDDDDTKMKRNLFGSPNNKLPLTLSFRQYSIEY